MPPLDLRSALSDSATTAGSGAGGPLPLSGVVARGREPLCSGVARRGARPGWAPCRGGGAEVLAMKTLLLGAWRGVVCWTDTQAPH